MTQPNKSSHGFTLIELLLAMTFFTTILLVTTAVTMQIFGIYTKGVVVKQMNSVGRTLTDDIIRTGNSSKGFSIHTYGDRQRCLKLGENVYIWGYYDDVGDDGNVKSGAFKVDPTTPINLSLYTKDDCPDNTDDPISVSDLQPLLSDNARVYVADMEKKSTTLTKLRLSIGTYSPLLTDLNPRVESGNVTCPEGSLGNFCAFSTYETVLYLPN